MFPILLYSPSPHTLLIFYLCFHPAWPVELLSIPFFPSHQVSSSTTTSIHEACGACYTVIATDEGVLENEVYLFRGEDCLERFLDSITITSLRLRDRVLNGLPLRLSAEEQKAADEATDCYLCGQPFTVNESRHRDHDHLTGAYRGVTHNRCNLNHR